MKGYYTNSCYMGWIAEEKKYMAFETEGAYINYVMEMAMQHIPKDIM